jgi:hypothetical protein
MGLVAWSLAIKGLAKLDVARQSLLQKVGPNIGPKLLSTACHGEIPGRTCDVREIPENANRVILGDIKRYRTSRSRMSVE